MKKLLPLLALLVLVGGVAHADHGDVQEHIDATQALLDDAEAEFTAGNWEEGQDFLTEADAELQLARAEEEPPPPEIILETGPPPARPATSAYFGGNTKVAVAVFVPDLSTNPAGWVPIDCSTGTAVISGTADIRVVAYVRNDGASNIVPRVRLTYTPGERWYQWAFPKVAPGQEVVAIDSIQDLEPGVTSSGFNFIVVGSATADATCNFQLQNIPANSLGFKSHRIPATTLLDPNDFEIVIKNYGNGVPIPCGSTNNGTVNRIKATLLYTGPAQSEPIHFHTHVETGPPKGIGPDQDGNPKDRRWWESGMYFTPVPNTNSAVSPDMAGFVTSSISGNTGVVHFGQQTGPGQPHVEIFCSFGT